MLSDHHCLAASALSQPESSAFQARRLRRRRVASVRCCVLGSSGQCIAGGKPLKLDGVETERRDAKSREPISLPWYAWFQPWGWEAWRS